MSNKPQDYRPRIVFDVDSELRDRLQAKLAWGDVKQVYTVFTEQLVELLENHDPQIVKAGIISRNIKLKEIIDYNKGKDVSKSD